VGKRPERVIGRTRVSAPPNFLVIGAMKAGTTSLFHYLRAHPQVAMSPLKEVDFFVEEGNWGRGFPWYLRQFDSADPRVIAIGEASTSYTKYPRFTGVPARIASLLPDVRLIYLLRDPVERIRSHYEHRLSVGTERAPLEEAIRTEPIYLTISRYAAQLDQYRDYFSGDRILLVTSEDLRDRRLPTMRRIHEFLGVDPDHRSEVLDSEFYQSTGRARYSPVSWHVRRALKRQFPATKRAKEFVDSTIPRIMESVVKPKAIRDKPPIVFTDHLRQMLVELLRDDVDRLRAQMPDGFDGWGMV
jgi:sulfotransferase family protein